MNNGSKTTRICSTQLVSNFTPWLLKEENWNHVHATIDEIKAKAFFARRPSFTHAQKASLAKDLKRSV